MRTMRINARGYLFFLAGLLLAWPVLAADDPPIKVGVLHSLTGAMAASERPVKDVILMAIDELNRAGGVLGRQIEAMVEDPASDAALFASKAEKLLQQDKAAAVFGCWTSASRKAVLPVFESHNGLLFYPVQYEGEECSKNIVYTGATLNQQALPAVNYLMSPEGGLRRRFFLIGMDHVYPRTTNKVLHRYLTDVKQFPDSYIMETYIPLDQQNYDQIAKEIKRFCLDGDAAVINTINGDSNVAFFNALAIQGMTADMCPVISFSLAEVELQHLDVKPMVGHMAAWNYFMSLPYSRNFLWINAYKAWCQTNEIPNAECVTSDPMMHAYIQVKLWAKAVERAQSTDTALVQRALAGMSINSPGGKYRVDAHNHHTWKPVYIGKIRADGQFDVIWKTKDWIRPQPWSDVLHKERGCDWSEKNSKGTYDIVGAKRVWAAEAAK